MLYFAYGSNMSQPRMHSRLHQAKYQGWAYLTQHQFRIHKRGRDGSAKGDALFTGNDLDLLYGVLYQLDAKDKRLLDRIEDEGIGYETKWVDVVTAEGQILPAFTYVALHIDRAMKPFHWYHEHILFGAEQANLPLTYIKHLRRFDVEVDHDSHRADQELELYKTL